MTDHSRNKGPRTANAAKARERILESAVREFSRNGFNGTSLEKIAAGAELSKAGVLHHFEGKAAIPFAFLGERDDAGERLTEAESTSLDVLESLVTVARRDVSQALETRVFAILAGEALGLDSPLRPWFHERYATLRGQISDALTNAVNQGLVRTDVDVEGIAAEALAVMDGLQVQYLLDDDAEVFLTRFAAYIERLVASIKT